MPLPVQFKTRQGDVTKDARIKNGYVEIKGEVGRVRKRPGNADLGLIEAGAAQLLTCWNGLLSIIGDSLASLVIAESGNSPIGFVDVLIPNDYLIYTQVGNLRIALPFEGASPSPGYVFNVETFEAQELIDDFSDWYYITNFSRNGVEARCVYLDDVGYRYYATNGVTSSSGAVTIDYDSYTPDQGGSIYGFFFSSSYYLYVPCVEGLVCCTSSDGVSFTAIGVPDTQPYTFSFELNGEVWSYQTFSSLPVPVIRSSDGLTWVSEGDAVGLPDDVSYPALVYGGKIYTTFGFQETDPTVYVSTDGINFNPYYSTPESWAYGGGVIESGGDIQFLASADGGLYNLTNPQGSDEVTPTPIDTLTPVTPSLALFAEATGSAQSSQQLFIKSDDQAWIYTR